MPQKNQTHTLYYDKRIEFDEQCAFDNQYLSSMVYTITTYTLFEGGENQEGAQKCLKSPLHIKKSYSFTLALVYFDFFWIFIDI